MLIFRTLRSLFSKKDDAQFVGGECEQLIRSVCYFWKVDTASQRCS